MAIYHLTVKVGSRRGGQSAGAAVRYICRTGRYRRHGNNGEDLVWSQSGNMPHWTHGNPLAYWDAADKYERANGSLFRSVEFALPRELNYDQQVRLVQDFVERVTAEHRLPYTVSIHDKGDGNPHAHLLISERENDGILRNEVRWFKRANPSDPAAGGAKKVRDLQSKNWLYWLRETWAKYANQALERAGLRQRIDHRSYRERGLDLVPTLHVGPTRAQPDAYTKQLRYHNQLVRRRNQAIQQADVLTAATETALLDVHQLIADARTYASQSVQVLRRARRQRKGREMAHIEKLIEEAIVPKFGEPDVYEGLDGLRYLREQGHRSSHIITPPRFSLCFPLIMHRGVEQADLDPTVVILPRSMISFRDPRDPIWTHLFSKPPKDSDPELLQALSLPMFTHAVRPSDLLLIDAPQFREFLTERARAAESPPDRTEGHPIPEPSAAPEVAAEPPLRLRPGQVQRLRYLGLDSQGHLTFADEHQAGLLAVPEQYIKITDPYLKPLERDGLYAVTVPADFPAQPLHIVRRLDLEQTLSR